VILPTTIYACQYGGQYIEKFHGESQENYRGGMTQRHPIQNGLITNWNDMEKFWSHLFYQELNVDPSEHRLIMTEIAFAPKQQRERMVQIAFETFNVSELYIGLQATMALYSTGKTTGIVLHAGEGSIDCVTVCDYALISNSVRCDGLSGHGITDYLRNLLSQRAPLIGIESARHIKERLGYVALNFQEEQIKSDLDKIFQLPDGKCLTVGIESCQCAEAMFNPTLMGETKWSGVHRHLFNVVSSLPDMDFKKEFLPNIIVSGGNAMFRGFEQRLTKEVNSLLSEQEKKYLKIEKASQDAAWLGANLLAQLSTFAEMTISRQEYDENGTSIVATKCSDGH
jgi:actin-related protein